MIGQPIDDNVFINIENDYYKRLFDGRLCPSRKNKDADTDAEEPDDKRYTFKRFWELFVYAAILGFSQHKPLPIKKVYKPFRWMNIGHHHQKNLLIMAVAKYGSFEILKDKDHLKKHIEEYANRGLSLIDQEIKNNPSAFADLETFTLRILSDLK